MTRADPRVSTPPLSTSLNNSTETTAIKTVDASTRRRFLAQAAAVTAAGAALATALSVPGSSAGAMQAPDPILEVASTIPAVSTPRVDAELTALGQKISELRALERKANAEVDRRCDAFDAIKPEKPHFLLWQPGDPDFLPPVVVGYDIGAHVADPWWIDMRFALQNEKLGVRLEATHGENARLAEVLDAWHTWQRGLDQARHDSGLADAEDRADVISAEMGGLYRQMLELKPQTLDGLRALATRDRRELLER